MPNFKNTLHKTKSIDFKGKSYFDYMIKMLFLFIVNEAFFITLTTKWKENIFLHADGHFVSYILFLTLGFFIWGITNSQRISLVVVNVSYLFISIVSALKINFLGLPLLLSDINFLKSTGSLLELVSIDDFTNLFATNTIMIIGCLIVILVFILKIHPRYIGMEDYPHRFVFCGMSLLIWAVLLHPTIFTTLVEKDFSSMNIQGYYTSLGVYSGLYGEYLNEKIEEPETYNEEQITSILNNTNTQVNDTWGTPNIIVVLSEAFYDIDKIEEISFEENIMEKYNNIKENNKTINMVSPTYAGLTANTEFEFLTGLSLTYLQDGYIPFNQLYNDVEKVENYPSIVKTLKDNGYTTLAYSPMDDGTIYNLKNIYPLLGFDNYYFYDDIYVDENSIKGSQISDEATFDKVLNDIEKIEEPYFCYVKTVENHMPYNYDKYEKEDIIVNVKETTLNEEKTFRLKLFAQGLYDANIQLERLYNEIQTFEEPTIIVYFGDHLPSVTTSNGEDILSSLSILNTNNEIQNEFNKFNTETLILSNFDLTINDDINTMSFSNLGSYILTHLSMKKDSAFMNYYNVLYEQMNVLSGGNKHFICDKYGNLYATSTMTQQIEESFLLKENLQYYYLKEERK